MAILLTAHTAKPAPQADRRGFVRLLGVCTVAACAGTHLPVTAFGQPTGKVVLTVSGQIDGAFQGGVAQFDLSMLQALPQHTFSTSTPWDPRPVKFSGPLLRDVLAAVRASGEQLEAVALNDYKVRLPMADAQTYGVVVAWRLNDQPIPQRTKGPLFLIYPFSMHPELDVPKYHRRSIWQLKAIRVL